MSNTPLIVLHWEAFYPYSELQANLQTISAKQFRLALPYGYLQKVREDFSNGEFVLGTNAMLNTTPGAFTENAAAKMLSDIQASFVLLGKASERTNYQDYLKTIKNKVQKAIQVQIPIFFCFGESVAEAEAGGSNEAISAQLKAAFEGIDPKNIPSIYFIYDTPTVLLDHASEEARNQAYETCRQQYLALWGEEVTSQLKTLCAIPSYLPIPQAFLNPSPFVGLYFNMIEPNFNWLLEAKWDDNLPSSPKGDSSLSEESEATPLTEEDISVKKPQKKAPKE